MVFSKSIVNHSRQNIFVCFSTQVFCDSCVFVLSILDPTCNFFAMITENFLSMEKDIGDFVVGFVSLRWDQYLRLLPGHLISIAGQKS